MNEQKPEPEFGPMGAKVLLRILGFFLLLLLIPWALVKIVDLLF